MSDFDINAYLASISDEALIDMAKECKIDLETAASEQPESEWHQSCFAAMVIYARELGARGLKAASVNLIHH